MSAKYLHVGKVLSAQGVRGDIFIYIFSQEAAWIDQWETLFISPQEDESPQRQIEILKVKAHQKQRKSGFVLKLKGFDNRNFAEEIIGQKVYIPEEFLISKEGEGIYLREILHFSVTDKERGPVGEVIGFMDNGFQDLLVIKHPSGEEFEVPFVEPLLIEIKTNEKEILMDIPFGLVPGEEL